MKKILILSSLLGLLFSTTSCREEFLQSEPTETIGNPTAQSKLYGLYLMMVNTSTGGTTGHDDFGQKGYDIYSDMLSSDMVLGATTYGWYRDIANFNGTSDYTNNINYRLWRYYYRIIYAANDVISGLGGNSTVPTSNTDRYAMGQAKAMRAYAYFYLSQFLNTEYNPSADSIPLYIDAGTTSKGKAKQSEVYGQIVADLKDAVTLLNGYSRPNKGVINQNVAKGLLAYTYAAMGENTLAASLSKQIIATTSITTREQTVYDASTKKGGGFNDLSTDSWMWGFDLTQANDLDLISWWGQVDIFSYSYAWAGDPKSIDLGLYSAIRPDDIRKNQFVTVTQTQSGYNITDATTAGTYPAVPANKFFAPERTIGGQRDVVTDYVFMRSDEFHLLAAETLAKSNQEAEAKTILKNFLSNRIADVTYIDGLSGDALKNEIYLQTRIELWGEGKSYLAMKRNKATITKGSNHLFYAGQSFAYNDSRLTLKIPQSEVNNNPNLK